MALYIVAYMLAAAGFSSGVLYEDNELHSRNQHVSDFTAVPELMFVMRQSRKNTILPRPICQAMMKLSSVSDGEFRYIVYFATKAARTQLQAFVTTLSLAITATQTGPRHYPNAMTFRTSQRGPFVTFKLMYADTENRCFVLVTNDGGFGKRACRLLQSSLTIGRVVPRACISVYTQNCPQESWNMYHQGCPTRIPHIVEWGR